MEYRFDHFRREHLRGELRFAAGRAPRGSVPDFDLATASGGRVRRSDVVGVRPVLIALASLTDPVAASAAPVLKRLHREFGGAAEFVTLYVRESHPGEHIPQPSTLDRKIRHARLLRDRDGLPWTVAVDDLEGSFHRALGGSSNGRAPAAYVVDRDGNIAFETAWPNDERALRRALEAAIAGRASGFIASGRRVVSMARGLARVDDVVREAGPDAVEDLRREAPALYVAAELAWLWRALTPLGRFAAMAGGVLAAVAVYGSVRGVRLLARRVRAA